MMRSLNQIPWLYLISFYRVFYNCTALMCDMFSRSSGNFFLGGNLLLVFWLRCSSKLLGCYVPNWCYPLLEKTQWLSTKRCCFHVYRYLFLLFALRSHIKEHCGSSHNRNIVYISKNYTTQHLGIQKRSNPSHSGGSTRKLQDKPLCEFNARRHRASAFPALYAKFKERARPASGARAAVYALVCVRERLSRGAEGDRSPDNRAHKLQR